MYEYYYGVSDYTPRLSHHGIKGMKWGIRRFQNPDGTLTEEGKLRYGRSVERGRELYEKGHTRPKEFAKFFLKQVGIDAASVILPNIIASATPVVFLASPHFASAAAIGKTAIDGIRMGLTLRNAAKTLKNLKDMDLSDKVPMSNEELESRTKRLKSEIEYNNTIGTLRDSKKNPGSAGEGKNGKNGSDTNENPWMSFAKEKANKFASSYVDRKITQVLDDKFKKPEKYSDIEKMVKDPNKYSDSDWEKASKRAEAISKSLTAVQNVDKNKKEKEKESETRRKKERQKSLAYKYVTDSTFRTKLKDFYKSKETKNGEEAVDKILDKYDTDKV